MAEKKTAFQFFCSVLLIISTSADTITPNQPLRDGETVVSAAGIYELGFFSGGGSTNRYVGIWYKKISFRTVVWVANRNSPVNDTSGVLTINNRGNLVLLGGGSNNNRTIWSSNSSRILENPVAWLSDGGNLVIKDAKDDGNDPEKFAWQSFDHPGNTLLSGMKLGKNLVNGLDWSISSWKTADDPSPGGYTASLNIDGYPQLFVTNGSDLQYSSGPWNGMAFTGSPVLKPGTYFTFELVITQDEVYYTYEVKDTSVPTRAVIIPTGVVQHLTWIERTETWSVYLTAQLDNCDRYGLCGPYASCSINNSPPCDCLKGFQPKFPAQWNGADWSSGCERRTPLACGDQDGFREFSGIKMPDSRHSWYDTNIDLKECKKRCLENCSCTAYSTLDAEDGSGCLLYFSELMDLRELSQNEQTLYVRVAASEVDAERNQKKKRLLMRIIIGSTVLGTLLICLISWCAVKRRTKRGSVDDNDMELPLFDLATVSSATKNFSAKNMIGEGGFGPVYKGKLASGQEIAVKRLSKHSVQGVEELKTEVNLISKLQHRNLVKLLGCCIEGEEGILIYEFMPNNSLDHFIFDPSRKVQLGWQKRFEIVMGISRGLLYLHQDSRLRIIHRDLKASNILLDNNFLPKISDFGLARIVGLDQNEGKTKRVVGTYGYMSPEYAIDGEFSVKSDVFSLGVLILELVSGRKNRTFHNSDHLHNLLGHAWILWKEDRAMEIMDESLEESCVESQVLRCIQVGLLCVQKLSCDRPNMASVVFMLGNEDVHLAEPKEPGFFVERGSIESSQEEGVVVETEQDGRVTENAVTLTILEAR